MLHLFFALSLLMNSSFEQSHKALEESLDIDYARNVQWLWPVQSTDPEDTPNGPTSKGPGYPPILKPLPSFQSSFVGQTRDQVAKFLTALPKDNVLDRRYFAVLDERMEKDGSMELCMIRQKSQEGEGEVWHYRKYVTDGTEKLSAMGHPEWNKFKEYMQYDKEKWFVPALKV